MTTRDIFYRRFGPLRDEATDRCTLDEINELRVALGLPPRTLPQALNALQAKLDTLPPYDWMNDEPG